MCFKLPLVAVMVRVKVPVGVLRLVFTVSVDEPEFVIDEGLKLALARRGSPLTLRLTVPAKPELGVMVTVNDALEPRETVAFEGATVTEKSALTASVTFAVCVKVPLVAVIVTG